MNTHKERFQKVSFSLPDLLIWPCLIAKLINKDERLRDFGFLSFVRIGEGISVVIRDINVILFCQFQRKSSIFIQLWGALKCVGMCTGIRY